MNRDAIAWLVLAGYAAVGLACLWRSRRRCPNDWRVWFLHIVARFYTPLIFRQHIQADCPLPADGPGLLIANHRSPLDPVLIYSASPLKRTGYRVRRPEFLTAAEYCNTGGLLDFITNSMGAIPVTREGRDMGPVKEALRRLKEGRIVGIFPEGRINTGAGLLPAIPGVAWLALHSRAPVYPAFIHGAPQADTMVQTFYKFSHARVDFGEPVDLSAYYGRRINQELLQEVTELLMTRLGAIGGLSPHEATGAQRTAGGRPRLVATAG
jgi:1-acyl-sn-glycerol-3-phosphate acyltransferase